MNLHVREAGMFFPQTTQSTLLNWNMRSSWKSFTNFNLKGDRTSLLCTWLVHALVQNTQNWKEQARKYSGLVIGSSSTHTSPTSSYFQAFNYCMICFTYTVCIHIMELWNKISIIQPRNQNNNSDFVPNLTEIPTTFCSFLSRAQFSWIRMELSYNLSPGHETVPLQNSHIGSSAKMCMVV